MPNSEAGGASNSPGGGTRVLFVTSNGTGLGHLARAMAIARRLPDGSEPVIFTLSAAAPVVAEMGFPVEYLPSYRLPASGSDWQWNLRLRHRLEYLIDELRPAALVFDGVHPYRALTHVLTANPDLPAMWVRRPMWREGKGKAALGRTEAFSRVLEPGELAASEDRGATVDRQGEAIRVRPIRYLDRDELLDRDSAAAELGLDPGQVNALVALGQGQGLESASARALARLTAADGVRPVALESSLAAGMEIPADAVHLRGTFPLARYYRAFDLAVSASGYNAFHELLAAGVPTLFAPMRRESDDQAARARWAQGAGVGLALQDADSPELVERLGDLLDPERRSQMVAALAALTPQNGAAAAAGAVADLIHDLPRDRPRALRRWLSYSSHPIGPSLPLAGIQLVRALRARRELGKPRAAVLALGMAERPAAELTAAVRKALADLSVDPGRALVITDSLSFQAIRELGCALEYVPGPEEATLLDGDYERFLRHRLVEILLRRRPRKALSLDPAHDELARLARARPRQRGQLLDGSPG